MFRAGGNKGFSLTELMITVGIMGIVILIILSGGQMLFKSAATSERSQEVTALMYETMSILGNPSLCSAAVVGRVSTKGTEIVVAPQIQANATYAGKIRIKSVALGEIQELSGNARKAEVVVAGEKSGEVFGGRDFSRAVSVFYMVDKDNKMQRCLGEAYDMGEICRAMGASWNYLNNRCDFCGSLGGEWSTEGVCVLDPTKQTCRPLTEAILGESLGGGVGYDKCDQWKQPWLNDVAKFFEVTLPSLSKVSDTDVAQARAAADEFVRQVTSFTNCTPADPEIKGSSGAITWHFKGSAADCDRTPAGTPRCALVMRFDINVCR